MNSSAAQNISTSMPLARNKNIMKGSKLLNKARMDDREYVEPTENDILRGRGGRINAHPGKQRLLDLVRAKGELYAGLKRGQKGKMGQDIVNEVRAWGGRFLDMEKGDDGEERYFVLDQHASIKLVEQKFRDDPSKRKSKCATQSKKAIRNQKKRPYGQNGVSTPSKVSSMKPALTVDDEDDSFVEMELCQDVFESHHSRRAMAAKVNEALSNLELTMQQDTRRFHCVSPTNSSVEQQLSNNSAERAQGGAAYDEVSLSDSSSAWNVEADQAHLDDFEGLDPDAFFTGADPFPADAMDESLNSPLFGFSL